jgi:hypothetical protein
MRRRNGTLLVGLALLAAACSSGEEPAASTTTVAATTSTATPTTPAPTTRAPAASTTAAPAVSPPGFTRYESDAEGFAIDVPDGWIVLTADEFDIGEFVEDPDPSGLDPELLAMVGDAFESGGVLWMFDEATLLDDFATNVNVLRIDKPGGLTARLFAAAAPSQIEFAGGVDVEVEVVALPAGDAVLTSYAVPAFDSEGIQYAVIGSNDIWVVTLSAPTVAGYSAVFSQIAESLTLG